MIYVSMVEDDDDLRTSLAMLINETPGFACCATYADCETAIHDISKDLPDVLLMDIGLPGMSGIEGIRRIKDKLPEMDVIMFTVHDDDNLVFKALCAGACGYLTKDTQPARVLEAIREAHQGGAPMSSNIARMVVESFKTAPASPLTPRETDILIWLCKGMSYKMIADTLFISQETVRSHLKHIYRKLQVSSKSEAVAKALTEKLVSARD